MSSQRRWRLLTLVAGTSLGLVGCGSSGDATSVASPGGSDALGIAHVHGLGIDPSDQSLYVATHYGLFRLPASGPAARVGDSFQDTMGFTVVDSNRLLGSGHPDAPAMQKGSPRLLGLIESTNDGATWSNMSLSGEVDFHGLVWAHDQVFGWDSTTSRLMVSDDGERWEMRSQLDLLSFVVDPRDEQHLLAATPTGLGVSTDGGRSWNEVSQAPPLVEMSWASQGSLWAADGQGGVYRSSDAGRSWQAAGRLSAPPQAFLAVDDDQLWAAVGAEGEPTGIYRSVDGGAEWMLRYRDEG